MNGKAMSDDSDLVAYLRRSYHAVDGLWFLMAEEAHGFETALDLDRRVWEVLAKIQARKARELTGCMGNTPQELARCFSLKLTADGHSFECRIEPGQVRFTIRECPWLALLEKSERRRIAVQVAQAICPTEGRVWCREFGGEYEYEMPEMQCAGDGCCVMRFLRAERA